MLEVRKAIAEAELSIATERYGRLGLIASLAFARFVHLYRKYNEDQPREERGRWVETGEDGQDDLPTGTVLQRYRTGNPDIDRVTEFLEETIDSVITRVGPGSGPVYGSRVHAQFAQSVRAADLPGIGSRGVETSFRLGDVVHHGLEGSIRTDVILRTDADGTGAVVGIWDVKTGTATLTPSRADELRRGVNVGSYVPVIEVHSRYGTSAKSLRALESRLAHADQSLCLHAAATRIIDGLAGCDRR